jgi:phosphoribosylglycinamide formyltransferase-1
MQMKRIAIFASGSGTNAENLIRYFRTSEIGRVDLILCNRPGAGVLGRVRALGVDTIVFNKEQFYQSSEMAELLVERDIDFIVLAGFLWLVPTRILEAYQGRVVNIHPALLPKYGGKGMYGHHVHKAVLRNREVESGITIHYVNHAYDEGDIIFQATCRVESNDTPDTLAERIHELEYQHFPRVIEGLLNKL